MKVWVNAHPFYFFGQNWTKIGQLQLANAKLTKNGYALEPATL